MLRGLVEHDVPSAIANSGFQAQVDADACTGCEVCVDRCMFGALSVPDGTCVVETARCIGCGVCIEVCADEALSLVRRPEDEVTVPPSSREEWAALRAESRGLPTQ